LADGLYSFIFEQCVIVFKSGSSSISNPVIGDVGQLLKGLIIKHQISEHKLADTGEGTTDRP